MAGDLTPPPYPSFPVEPESSTLVPSAAGGLPMPQAQEREEKVNWGRYLSALYRYRILILLIVILGSGAGVMATRFIPPEFTVRATIWIEPTNKGAGPIRPGELLNSFAWVELFKTFQIFDPVVHKLRLFVTPENREDRKAFVGFDVQQRFQAGKFKLSVDPKGERWRIDRNGEPAAVGAVGDSVGTTLGWKWQPTSDVLTPGRVFAFTLVSPREVSTTLQSQLRIQMAEDGNFMRVSLAGNDKWTLAPTLNALCDQFVDVAYDLKRRQLTETRLALDSQVTIAYENLRNAESRLKTFQINTITKPRNGVLPVSPGLVATQGTATQTYFNQKVVLEGIRQDRQQLEAVLQRSKGGAVTADAFQTIPSVNNAPALKQALADLTTREADLRALRTRYTDEHPLIKQSLAAIQELKTKTIPQLASALIDQLRSQEQDLQSRINAAGTELREIPEVTIEEMRLQRDLTAAEELHKVLRDRLEEAKLSELSTRPDVKILDTATTPQAPSSNTAPKIIAMAVAASLGFALALALLLDQLDKRVRYPEQVTQELGLPILGAIPAFTRGSRKELTPELAAQVVEAFRTVRLNLAHSYGAAGPVLLTISSPGAGDGKSLVSSNLAVSFAEAGYRTLLLDGDIRRGELHRMFGVDRRPGLLDFLAGQARLDEILRPTPQAGLTLITCGTRRYQGPELLGSARMAEALAEFKSRFHVILVDSPPLGAGIDPFVLGAATGHMLLVFRSGETDRQMADAKLRLLDRLPVRVLGAVLNDIRAEGSYRYYSYLYGYTAEEEPHVLAGKGGSNGNGVEEEAAD